MNWNDPEDRARLIERVGPREYNRLQAFRLPLAASAQRFGSAAKPRD
jgi:hypothetical protein